MLRPFGEKGQPPAEDGNVLRHRVLALRPAKPGGAAEQAGEGDRGRVGHQKLRRVRVAGTRLAASGGLFCGDVTLHAGEDQVGQLGGEGETLVAVTWLRHDEQRWFFRVGADHRGERGVRLAGQRERDEHQRTATDVDVADGGYRLSGFAFDRDCPGKRR